MINEAIPGGGVDFAGYYERPRLSLLDLYAGPAPKHVLEFGCGAGANLSALKRRYPACQTTGVELRPDAAAAARARGDVDALLVGDLLDPAAVPLQAAAFDLVVLSHVLEHFAEPNAVLARARHGLAPGGQLLVALPNIRHAWVLIELLWHGDFQYRPAGILDNTHLRFYTRKSAIRFLTASGWRVEACQPDIEGAKSRALARWSLGLASDFAAFAYNFRLRPA